MPDLLTHLGTGYLACRGFVARRDLLLILLGALIPDLAWIVKRAILTLTDADPVTVVVWVTPWHTPWTVLLVSAAIGLVSGTPWRAGAVVFAAGLVHMVFDTAQTRWGNGVTWLYPFSMGETSWEMFWPESPVNHGLALGSLVLLGGIALGRLDRPSPIRPDGERTGFVVPGALRAALAVACLLAIVATIAMTRGRLVEGNVFALGFVTDPAKFEGRPVALDRDRIVDVSPTRIETFNGRELELAGAPDLRTGQSVSVKGIYRDGRILVREMHSHTEGNRSAYSYLGLMLFGLVLVRLRRRPR